MPIDLNRDASFDTTSSTGSGSLVDVLESLIRLGGGGDGSAVLVDRLFSRLRV